MSPEEIIENLAKDMRELLSAPVGSKRIAITDLTPRDGQQCKLATRVSTDDLLLRNGLYSDASDDEDGDARQVIGEVESPSHAEPLGDRLERLTDLLAGDAEAGQLPLDALEEDALLGVGVLVGVDDVALVAVQEIGHRGHQALLVRAGEEQDCGHGLVVHLQ